MVQVRGWGRELRWQRRQLLGGRVLTNCSVSSASTLSAFARCFCGTSTWRMEDGRRTTRCSTVAAARAAAASARLFDALSRVAKPRSALWMTRAEANLRSASAFAASCFGEAEAGLWIEPAASSSYEAISLNIAWHGGGRGQRARHHKAVSAAAAGAAAATTEAGDTAKWRSVARTPSAGSRGMPIPEVLKCV